MQEEKKNTASKEMQQLNTKLLRYVFLHARLHTQTCTLRRPERKLTALVFVPKEERVEEPVHHTIRNKWLFVINQFLCNYSL